VEQARDLAPDELHNLLSDAEVEAFIRRGDQLLHRRRLPRPRGAWPSIPWPPF
jgi:hypothetical protein